MNMYTYEVKKLSENIQFRIEGKPKGDPGDVLVVRLID